jgi:hypothetical protein
MRLVGSSTPGAVERDSALVLLVERAVLTRMLCTEAQDHFSKLSRRPDAAFGFLLGWIDRKFPNRSRGPYAADGIAEMVVPKGCEPLMEEIRAGAEVAKAYEMLQTADSSVQLQGGSTTTDTQLASFRNRARTNNGGREQAPIMAASPASIPTSMWPPIS